MDGCKYLPLAQKPRCGSWPPHDTVGSREEHVAESQHSLAPGAALHVAPETRVHLRMGRVVSLQKVSYA